jgi:hypothetical protein
MKKNSSIYSSVVHPFYKTETVLNALNKHAIPELEKKKDGELEDLSSDELNDVIYRLEKSALSCRMAIERKGIDTSLGYDGTDYSKTIHELPSDLEYVEEENIMFSPSTYERFSLEDFIASHQNYITVSFKNDVLRIKTPITFKRFTSQKSVKQNYVLFDYVNASLKNWESKTGNSLEGLIQLPCIVILKRKLRKFNKTTVCDNDNMESGRIINAIFDNLMYSDNAKNMDIYSCFRECSSKDEEGMEFIVFSRKSLKEHLDEFE